MLFSLGSLMAMGSVAMLRGPGTFVAQLVAPGQRVFSACYLGSLLGTLYCACVLRVTLATAFFGVIQVFGCPPAPRLRWLTGLASAGVGR